MWVARCVGLSALGVGVAYLLASDSQRKAFWALFWHQPDDNGRSASYPSHEGNVPEIDTKTRVKLSFKVCSSNCIVRDVDLNIA